MRTILLSCLIVVLAAIPVTSHARPGLELSWNACAGSGGDSTLVFDCRNPEGLAQLIGTFQTADTVKNMVALSIVLDLETETGDLPPFWRFEVRGCNEAGITMSDALPAKGCEGATNLWGENGLESFSAVTGYGPEFESYRNRGRMVCLVYRPSSSPVTLVPGVRYYAFTLRFFSDNASEAGGKCSGCRTPIKIAWSAASLSTTSGRPGVPDPPDRVLTGPGDRSNCVRLNGARGPCVVREAPKAWTDTTRADGHGHDH